MLPKIISFGGFTKKSINNTFHYKTTHCLPRMLSSNQPDSRFANILNLFFIAVDFFLDLIIVTWRDVISFICDRNDRDSIVAHWMTQYFLHCNTKKIDFLEKDNINAGKRKENHKYPCIFFKKLFKLHVRSVCICFFDRRVKMADHLGIGIWNVQCEIHLIIFIFELITKLQNFVLRSQIWFLKEKARISFEDIINPLRSLR